MESTGWRTHARPNVSHSVRARATSPFALMVLLVVSVIVWSATTSSATPAHARQLRGPSSLLTNHRASKGGFGRPVKVTYQGYVYDVRAARLTIRPKLAAGAGEWPDGISAPPGRGYLTIKLEVKNPLAHRSEPVTAFDDGAGNVNAVVLVVPTGDPVPVFDCNSSGVAATTYPSNAPTGCLVPLLVQNDPVAASGASGIGPRRSNQMTLAVGGPVPSKTRLGRFKLYFYDELSGARPVLIPLPTH